ncbi:MAG: hypothetical protein ACERKD_14735 [Prolixibacteraceae bacterium]
MKPLLIILLATISFFAYAQKKNSLYQANCEQYHFNYAKIPTDIRNERINDFNLESEKVLDKYSFFHFDRRGNN